MCWRMRGRWGDEGVGEEREGYKDLWMRGLGVKARRWLDLISLRCSEWYRRRGDERSIATTHPSLPQPAREHAIKAPD